MRTHPLDLSHASRRQDGFALVIVLAFLVLLTGLAVAFFSRALTERQVSNSSAAQTKADIIAHSATSMILGDLKQEIVNGSTSASTSPAPSVTIYTPTSNLYMIPQQSGVPTTSGTSLIPNLIRCSVRSDPMVSPGVGSRASAVNSTTDVSLNGRSVALTRWNSHYLIPRLLVGGTTINSTPMSAFTPPDWVMVTSQKGPDVLSTPTVDGSGNAVTVIGRYAYAIYNEGGLLDMNVAGYPSSISAAQSSLKGALAFADLTQIGLVNSGTPNQVDTILGWRNNATIQPAAGSVSSGYSFQSSPTTGTNYYNYIVSNTTGFLAANPIPYPSPATSTSRTDQMFSSRQALIKMMRAIGFSQDALQYMGTFSRDLEQPSFVPNPGRPKVQDATGSNTSPFGIGNDAYGTDRTGTPSTDINPPFLTVRVGASFTRPDGSTANVGDPLVVKRFPLSRLGLILSNATNTNSQSDPIYRNFGLYRSSAESPWTYNHGNSTGIYRLDQMKALGREADFFELLKAAINVGSLGKSCCYSSNNYLWTQAGTEGNLQNSRDLLTALQTLQIGANIIDQYKSDNFPTQIQFAGSSTYTARGVEDLPYLYRFRNWVMRTSVTTGILLLQPELWNPHSPGSSALVSGTATPKNFRVRVTRDPSANSAPVTLTAVYGNSVQNTVTSSVTLNSPNSYPDPVTFNAGESNGYWGFREPTLLAQINTPAASSLQGDVYTDYPVYAPNPNRQMTGLLVGAYPWYSGTTSNVVYKLWPGSTGNNSCIHFYLDYLDPNSNWITYDDQQWQYDALTLLTQVPNNGYAMTVQQLQQVPYNTWGGGARTDPRTSRWGYTIGEYMNLLPVLDLTNNMYSSYRPDTGLSYGDHVGGRQDAGFVGAGNAYLSPNVGSRGFQHGYWAENSIRPTYQYTASDTGDPGLRYNVDPDGIPRRTMGGYATDTTNGGVLLTSTNGTTTGVGAYGLPMVTGTYTNYISRPTLLHRPFRSVAELGYIFRDTPWSNISLSFPESGDAALLDVFCLNETSSPTGLVAGRVDLNTRQAPVIQALISGSLLDKDNTAVPLLSATMASTIAAQLVNRTANTTLGPLVTRADLVGTWTFGSNPATAATALKTASNPGSYYTGFSADIGAVANVMGTQVALIPRQREAVVRALADAGGARIWNLMIDVVAQSGRYPPSAQSLANFVVEGEKRYWLHIAIDRLTGNVLDRQLELVTE